MASLLRPAFWAAAAFAFAMAVLPQQLEQVQISDKLQHMAAFFVLTALGCAAYRGLSRVRLMLAMVAFGAAIELVQLLPFLQRDAEWSDWLADIVAVILALTVAHFVESPPAGRRD
jgi:VanZ family protein